VCGVILALRDSAGACGVCGFVGFLMTNLRLVDKVALQDFVDKIEREPQVMRA
jgi:hypothetical protein